MFTWGVVVSRLRYEVLREIGEDADLGEALDMSVTFEEESRVFYQVMADKTDEPNLRMLYEFLADEEYRHEEQLQSLQPVLAGGDLEDVKWGFSQVVPVFGRQILEEFSSQELGDVPKEYGALIGALKVERRAEYIYEVLARRVDESAHEEFFTQLADFERSHYELVEGLLEGLSSMQTEV